MTGLIDQIHSLAVVSVACIAPMVMLGQTASADPYAGYDSGTPDRLRRGTGIGESYATSQPQVIRANPLIRQTLDLQRSSEVQRNSSEVTYRGDGAVVMSRPQSEATMRLNPRTATANLRQSGLTANDSRPLGDRIVPEEVYVDAYRAPWRYADRHRDSDWQRSWDWDRFNIDRRVIRSDRLDLDRANYGWRQRFDGRSYWYAPSYDRRVFYGRPGGWREHDHRWDRRHYGYNRYYRSGISIGVGRVFRHGSFRYGYSTGFSYPLRSHRHHRGIQSGTHIHLNF